MRSKLPFVVLLAMLAVTLEAHADPALAPPERRSVTTEELVITGRSRDHRAPATGNDTVPKPVPVTLFVPVRLTSLDPRVSRVFVFCIVASTSAYTAFPYFKVANGSTTIVLEHGGYVGTVAVAPTLAPGKKAADMHSYSCGLTLETALGDRKHANEYPTQTLKDVTQGTL